jgi:hypothetical protein
MFKRRQIITPSKTIMVDLWGKNDEYKEVIKRINQCFLVEWKRHWLRGF